MSTITLTTVANLLEKVIQPAVQDQMNTDFIGYNLAKKVRRGTPNSRIVEWGNDKYYITMKAAHHSGAAAIAEDGSLNNGKPTHAQSLIQCKWQTGSQLLTKQSISNKSRGEIVPILSQLGKDLVVAMKADQSRQFYGTGDGIITTANGAGSSATTLNLTASTNGDIDFADYCPPGTYLRIGSGGTPFVVTSIAGENSLTIPSTTWSDLDSVYKCDGVGAIATEMTGLRTLLSNSATFQNIAPGTNEFWKPAYLDTTSEKLTFDKIDTAYIKANKVGNVEDILMNMTLFKRYGQIAASKQAVLSRKEVLGGGWVGLDYMGGKANVVLDYDVPDDWVILYSKDAMTYGQQQALEWEKGSAGTMLRVIGKINYEVAATECGEFGCHARRAFAALSGKTG